MRGPRYIVKRFTTFGPPTYSVLDTLRFYVVFESKTRREAVIKAAWFNKNRWPSVQPPKQG
jgi:hypothetical protein